VKGNIKYKDLQSFSPEDRTNGNISIKRILDPDSYSTMYKTVQLDQDNRVLTSYSRRLLLYTSGRPS